MRKKRLLALILIPIILFSFIQNVHASIVLVTIPTSACGGGCSELALSGDGILGHGMGQGDWQVSPTAFVTQLVATVGKFGSPTGTAVARIFNDVGATPCATSGAQPTGSPIDVSNAVDVSTFTTSASGALVQFSFPQFIPLSSSNCYDWVISQDTGFTDINNVVRVFACNIECGAAGTGAALAICTPAPTCSVAGSNDANGWELDGLTSVPSSTTITQCFGNCGTPPITLANTNSTHLTNFNQTITLLYEFQSTMTGILLNVTTSVAKSYSNGQGVSLAVYTIPSCPVSSTPFSAQCPGFISQSGLTINPTKGKVSLPNLQVSVFNGQWVAVAVTTVFAPIDLNDTNTVVNLFQTNEGKNPAVIQQASFLTGSKMGLWAWIIGNIVTGAPPPPTGCISLATLDCLLPALVNSLCSNTTQQCQTSSALFWVLVFTIISEFALGMSFAKISPSIKMPIGESFTFILLIWIFIMTGLSLLLIWIPVFFFMIGSLAFSKHTGKYF